MTTFCLDQTNLTSASVRCHAYTMELLQAELLQAIPMTCLGVRLVTTGSSIDSLRGTINKTTPRYACWFASVAREFV
jgi:hypothetical protein